jgi:aspartate racemase
MKDALGILGGLGPFASADFLLSIYEHNISESEQQAPVIVLYSDPSFPDRTTEFLASREDRLLQLLEEGLSRLWSCNVRKMVIACITIHHVLPRVAPHLREATISLTDVTLDTVVLRQQPALLLATEGTRRMRVFEASERWDEASRWIITPDDADQEKVHERLYAELKMNSHPREMVPFVTELCRKYGVTQLIAGCTELHRLSRHLLLDGTADPGIQIIDPLLTIAQNYKEFLHEHAKPHVALC